MSPTKSPAPPPGPWLALALVCIGLFVGTLGSFVVANALQQRHAVPKGSMGLMQYHYNQARRTAATHQCQPERAAHHLRRIAELAEDSPAIFASIGVTGPGFDRRNQALLAEIEQGLAQGAHCETISRALKHVGDACSACHHEVR